MGGASFAETHTGGRASVPLGADDHDKVKIKVKRYYDRDSKDWHEWNEREQRAYGRYLEEKTN